MRLFALLPPEVEEVDSGVILLSDEVEAEQGDLPPGG
jgi:hypothetical protein